MKRFVVATILAVTILLSIPQATFAYRWTDVGQFTISKETIPLYTKPDLDSDSSFILYKGMTVKSYKIINQNGIYWIQTKMGNQIYYLPAIEQGKTNITLKTDKNTGIKDYYGILNMPHRYAVKFVKLKGAKGRLEIYERVKNKYNLRKTYEATYPKEGPKNIYGDLKTVGGPVIRYLYRTRRSKMNGSSKGKRFGVYKVSYPMPHDALPYLQSGRMSVAQYNRIPAINWQGPKENPELYPHPQGMLGADILIHTAAKGSIGCINVKNDEMSDLYNVDLPTENNKEIIPFIIYDENIKAPKIGKLF